jgi:hypothetical protein
MKPFSDGEIEKECLEAVAYVAFHGKVTSFLKLFYQDSPLEE